MSGSDEDSDDQSVESLFDRQTTVHKFSQQSNSSSGHLEARGVAEGEKLLINIFKCTICLSTSKIPAAACSSCFHIIGCVPCIEQWYELPANTGVKCPLCRGATKYEVVPIVREMLQQPLPTPRVPTVQRSDTESVDTIPYGEREQIQSDEELPPGLQF